MLWRPSGNVGDRPVQASSVLSRRRVLGTAAAATAIAFVTPSPAVSFAPRSVSLYNIHTGEWVRTVYLGDGPLLPRGGPRHQLGSARPPFGRGAADECRGARPPRHAAQPPRKP